MIGQHAVEMGEGTRVMVLRGVDAGLLGVVIAVDGDERLVVADGGRAWFDITDLASADIRGE